jgi:tetratricopeptide (TPR) repeat protein
MSQEGFKRKLTSIFSTDAVGYSRLMGEDETATVRTLTSYRNIISSLIKQNQGTVIDSPGDNLLAEFSSVDDAIQSLETAFRFDPNQAPGSFMFLGIGYYLKGQYEKAIILLEEGLSRNPDWAGNHIILAAAYAQSGRSGDAKREAQEVLRLEPFFAIDNYGTVFRNQADRAKIIQGEI